MPRCERQWALTRFLPPADDAAVTPQTRNFLFVNWLGPVLQIRQGKDG